MKIESTRRSADFPALDYNEQLNRVAEQNIDAELEMKEAVAKLKLIKLPS